MQLIETRRYTDVNGTDALPSVRFPWLHFHKKVHGDSKIIWKVSILYNFFPSVLTGKQIITTCFIL
jgi:hypothetical protein